MNVIDDNRTEQEVREDTIDDLIAENDLNDMQRMQREIHEELDATDEDREAELLEYRLDILFEAIDQVTED